MGYFRLYLNAQRIIPGRLWILRWKGRDYTVNCLGFIQGVPGGNH